MGSVDTPGKSNYVAHSADTPRRVRIFLFMSACTYCMQSVTRRHTTHKVLRQRYVCGTCVIHLTVQSVCILPTYCSTSRSVVASTNKPWGVQTTFQQCISGHPRSLQSRLPPRQVIWWLFTGNLYSSIEASKPHWMYRVNTLVPLRRARGERGSYILHVLAVGPMKRVKGGGGAYTQDNACHALTICLAAETE